MVDFDSWLGKKRGRNAKSLIYFWCLLKCRNTVTNICLVSTEQVAQCNVCCNCYHVLKFSIGVCHFSAECKVGTTIPPTQSIKALCIIVQGYEKGQAEEYQEKVTFIELY